MSAAAHTIDLQAGVPSSLAKPETEAHPVGVALRDDAALRPNFLVRWAFFLSVFTIPFTQLYLPGTGGRIGVTRLVQLLMLAGILSQPRVCLRFVPAALFWFLGYIGLRIVWGFWLTPERFDLWWASSREFIELLPWVWFMFNVLQFPETRQGGLWALGFGCSLCALFHIAGVGVTEVSDGLDNRISAFGLNANDLGVTYATAATALLGLWVYGKRTMLRQLLPFPLIAIIGIAMAKTGSRSAMLLLAVGVFVLLFLARTIGFKVKRIASLVLLGTMVALTLWQIPTVLQRFEEINTGNLGQNNPRARMAPVLVEMFLRSPIYGSGPDSYEFELTRRAMPYLIAQQRTIVAHNLALLLLVETGVVGFLVFSVGIGKALSAAWWARLKAAGPLPLALLLPLIIAAATVSQPIYLPIFWLTVAYALAGAA